MYNILMFETRFSIIIPVYNTRKDYLEKSIFSAFNQNYSNYEVIIVNDGSNEETSSFLNKLENDKLTLISQKNQGQYKSRINALHKATGDYILFFDSDDILDQNSLNILNDLIIKHQTDIVMFALPRFTNDHNNLLPYVHYYKEGLVDKKTALTQIANFHACNICSKCAKRQLLLKTNLDCNYKYGEDLVQATELMLNANSFYYTNKVFYYYRVNQEARDYYSISDVGYINYLSSVYKILFKDSTYNDLLPIYKSSAANAISYVGLGICKLFKNYGERKNKLDELNRQEVVEIAKNIDAKMPMVSTILFYLTTHSHYFLLTILSYVYEIIYGFEKVTLK